MFCTDLNVADFPADNRLQQTTPDGSFLHGFAVFLFCSQAFSFIVISLGSLNIFHHAV